MRWRWALFDVGGTLIGPRDSFGAVYSRVLRAHGLSRDAGTLDRALRATWAEVSAGLPPGADRYGCHSGGESGFWLGIVRRTLERSGGELPPGIAERSLEPLRAAFSEPAAWSVFPEVEATLERLASAGMRLGVVSNWDSGLPRLLERLGLARWFETLAVSALAGVEKPDPALFERALADLGADPGRTVHVGDVPELDVAGARAAGIHPILLDRRVLDLRAVADLLLPS
jgi:putative hydrolase of the HAD superfamily